VAPGALAAIVEPCRALTSRPRTCPRATCPSTWPS
jgi:hypothetical protein